MNDPKPKRRSALRHALGGLALLAVMALNLALLEYDGITDWGSWTRHARAQFGGGREGMRKQVFCGMTRKEVEARIGEGRGGFITVLEPLDLDRPPTPPRYPLPYQQVEYREYGFAVVYHCRDIAGPNSWTVSSVEDLP